MASGDAAPDAVTVAVRSLPLTWQHHPSQHQSCPHKRSDKCCYPSRHTSDIWLSVVPYGLSYNRSTLKMRSV